MIRQLLLPAALLATLAMPASAQTTDAHRDLQTLFGDEWERGLRDFPENATANGDHRFDDRWTDLGLAALEARDAADRAALERARRIDRKALSASDRVDYDGFLWQLERTVERQKFREFLQPISHQGGVQTADNIVEVSSFASVADYRHYLARLAALPRLVEQNIVLMKEGLKAGLRPPRILMQRVPAQIAAQVVDDPTHSAFYRPLRQMPESIPAAEAQALGREAQALIRDQVVPAYRRLQAYFERDYLPQARDSIAAIDRPDGLAYYDFLARYYTTTGLGAEEIHAIGLAEVARLRAAMETVKAETGFKGSMAEFFTFLRTDPRFFCRTPAELLQTYRAVAKRIDPELVKVFRNLPRLPYGVRAIPDNIAPDTTAAYYQNGASDGSRPGYYYVNLYKPESRPTWEMVPLTLHEAVPGHHLQFARALEFENASMFRKTAYFVAYGEGWALYAEQLGYEMGLYDDPYDRFGQLTYEMWRAVRLVVDTGMHAKGWSREQAIAYFKDNTAKTDQDIVNEIDRYIGTPAQALAYKIGQMKISELRALAARELGPKFDLRDYNDEVLATGSVPLAALEERIRAWAAARR